MNKIEVKILNEESIYRARQMTAFAARLTQRGHKLENMEDVYRLYEQPASDQLIENLTSLPHPTIQKFSVINVVVVGASRRFLAQITRHQNEVKFMSASLQYSDYSGYSDFCVPYQILKDGTRAVSYYIAQCSQAMAAYREFAKTAGNDAAGYLAPQGLRNILVISATPYQWKHMISQRICHRNTDETRFVMLKIWHELEKLDHNFFSPKTTGAECQRSACKEGRMCCQCPINRTQSALDILYEEFPLIVKKEE